MCTTCGVVPDTLHMPTRERGWFCPAHCPVCKPWLQQQTTLGLGVEQDSAEIAAAMILTGEPRR